MLTIQLYYNREDVLPYCQKAKKLYGTGFYIYKAMNNGKELATGLFEVQSDRVIFTKYFSSDTGDPYLLDGILRSAFNYASEQSINTGVIPENVRQQNIEEFKQLNYPPQSVFRIDNFFTKYKNCTVI